MTETELDDFIRRVRKLTTRSTLEITNNEIEDMMRDNTVDGLVDYYGVVADVWSQLASDIRFRSQTVGNLSVSQPTAAANAEYYRAKSRTGGGAPIQQKNMRRGDIEEPDEYDHAEHYFRVGY